MDWFLYDNGLRHERVQRQTYEMVKHTQTIRQVFPNNCLSVFDHFVRLALKGLKSIINLLTWRTRGKKKNIFFGSFSSLISIL